MSSSSPANLPRPEDAPAPGQDSSGQRASRPVRRRQLLLGAAVASGGAAIAGTAGYLSSHGDNRPDAASNNRDDFNGTNTLPFYGARQSGIDTPAQAHVSYLGLDLNSGSTPDAVQRLLSLLSNDAAKLSKGQAALADMEAELAVEPARLTVTFGFGPELFQASNQTVPEAAQPLPAFSIDKLRKEYGQTDLLLQICCDDPITLAHAVRQISKDARAFTSLRWAQNGFRRAYGTEAPDRTMRNLFGQLDGTANARPGSEEQANIIWGTDNNPSWRPDGTTMVLRRIAMDLDKWDSLDRDGREESIGRRLSDGAPLTGGKEFDTPDFTAKNSLGFPVISDVSHVRRSRSDNPQERIFRRAYNYDEPSRGGEGANAGLLFASYQANIARQFTPIQQRLADVDLLNHWTTPIGSAVYVIPPGCQEGGYIGDWLFAQ